MGDELIWEIAPFNLMLGKGILLNSHLCSYFYLSV